VSQPALPSDVQRFLIERVVGIDDLDVLLLVCRTADRWWDARSIAVETGLPPSQAAAALERLGAKNLLDVRLAADVLYRFHPVAAELGELVARVVEAHRTHRAAVLSVVLGARPTDALRDFAEAFRLKKDR
jgi:hypothetical protein